ncbi:MAG TPA: Bax inhibitor-1/YccA family protein [Candidatus Limnocylindrales bacterium]
MSDPRSMNPFSPTSTTAAFGADAGTRTIPDARTQQALLTQSFLWMFAGLVVTAGLAYFVQSNTRLLQVAADNILLLFVGQFVLVLGIQFGIRRFSATAALGAFFVYAASMGLTVGLIVSFYTQGSVATAFISASAMFGAAAVYGHVTKRSLAGIGGMLFMGVIGLLVASVINIFLLNDTFSLIISIVGVVLFTVLTAFHVQRIQNGDLAVYTGSMEKGAVLGALLLYLDFVNIFLFLLRLFGSRD